MSDSKADMLMTDITASSSSSAKDALAAKKKEREKKMQGGNPVEMSYQVFKISSIDAVGQTYYCDFTLYFAWTDKSLINAKPDEVDWSKAYDPEFYIKNAIELETTEDEKRLKDPETGRVVHTVHYRGTLSQWFRLKDFPFDAQNIRIEVSTRKHKGKAEYVPHTAKENIVDKFHSTEWTVESHRIKYVSTDPDAHPIGNIYSEAQIKIRCSRAPNYYIWNVAMPTFMLVCLAFFVTGMDYTDFASRMSITLTVILTTVAFKFAIGESLPKVSYFTVLDSYVFGANIFVYVMALLNWISVKMPDWSPDTDAKMLDDYLTYAWVICWGIFNIFFGVYTWWVQKKVADKGE